MATRLVAGGNVGLAGASSVRVCVTWQPASVGGFDVDASAFALRASGKVRSDADFCFYNQPRILSDALALDSSAGTARFAVDLGFVPPDIEKIAFALTVHGAASFGSASSVSVQVEGFADFDVDLAGRTEAALILGELYRRQGDWKFRAVGQGFVGGLAPLATHFGVDVSDDGQGGAGAPAPPPAAAPAPAPAAAPAPAPAPASAAPAPAAPAPAAPAPAPAAPAPAPAGGGGRVSLSKITLDKKGESTTVSLDKRATGEIAVNLNWSQKRGFFSSAIDLDLGCYFELRDGTRSVIDGLQFSQGRGGPRHHRTRQGCYTEPPWVWHQGDDRSGAVSEGETLFINPKGISELRRMTIYAFIYEGAAAWAKTDAVVTVKVPGQPEIVVEMGRETDRRTFCAIAALDFSGSTEVKVTKLITFHDSHSDCDRRYSWGFQWSAGSKD